MSGNKVSNEWWEGLPTEIESEWWDGLPTDEPELTSIEIAHPALDGGKLTLYREGERWMIGEVSWGSKKLPSLDGVAELAIRNLMLEDHTAMVPKLVETGGRNREEYCPVCLSQILPRYPHYCRK